MIESEENQLEINLEEDNLVEKAEKLEKERQEILNNAVRGRIENIRDKVAYLLNNFTAARNSDIELTWLFWETFEKEIFTGLAITKQDLFRLTKLNSISRVRAKIQNEYKLFQADDKVKKYRGVLEEEKKQEAIEDKPNYPLYTIFIDETGKTQDYLSVGSLWITDPRQAFLSRFELISWIKSQKIEYEFHFTELTHNKLDQYKAFFLKFLVLHPSAGFKSIILNRAGLQNINSAITDLTFHLINNGIWHENYTGRAPLPRLLQVWIDNEEKGSDKLKLENIRERIMGQKINGLHLDSFEVVDSKGNLYLQIVDLFISSINRKLHNPNSTSHPKDLLADYILGLLNFDLLNVDKTNKNVDKSMVFNLAYNK